MKILPFITTVILVVCISGMPLFGMAVPSGPTEPAEEETPAHSGGYLSEGEAILFGVLICLLVLIII